MKKRICAHCGEEISGSRGGRAVYCSERCKRSAERKRLAARAAGGLRPTKHRIPCKPMVPNQDVDRLFKRCSATMGDCDPWLERRDYGQYNYNADFVLGF